MYRVLCEICDKLIKLSDVVELNKIYTPEDDEYVQEAIVIDRGHLDCLRSKHKDVLGTNHYIKLYGETKLQKFV